LILSASYDSGRTWSSPIQVNDNTSQVDAFQPNLTTASDGTVVLAFYDRRLACPTDATEAANAGRGLDSNNPISRAHYCVNHSVQFYKPDLS
jgi:hypothetical protein